MKVVVLYFCKKAVENEEENETIFLCFDKNLVGLKRNFKFDFYNGTKELL